MDEDQQGIYENEDDWPTAIYKNVAPSIPSSNTSLGPVTKPGEDEYPYVDITQGVKVDEEDYSYVHIIENKSTNNKNLPKSEQEERPHSYLELFSARPSKRCSCNKWCCFATVVFGLAMGGTLIALLVVLKVTGLGKPASTSKDDFGVSKPPWPTSESGSDTITGTFITECAVQAGSANDDTYITDLCWSDPSTIIVGQGSGKQLLKLSIDFQSGACHPEVVDNGYSVFRISCMSNNKVMVIDETNWEIKTYDIQNNILVDTWKPKMPKYPHTIASNNDYTILSSDANTPMHIYTSDKVFQKSINIYENTDRLSYTYLTNEGLLLATTGFTTNYLFIYDVSQNVTIKKGGYGEEDEQFKTPYGVTQIPGGPVIVTDSNNNRLSVWSITGQFLHMLKLGSDETFYPSCPSIISAVDGTTYLALRLGGTPYNIIKIFRLGR